jgi:hypothetical protein
VNLSSILLLINAASAWFMTGLIWFVQIVHYPQFEGVGNDAFNAYHERHTRMTTWVVGPPMLIEAFSAVGLIVYRGAVVSAAVAWTGLALLIVIWLSTAFLQVPRHNVLSSGWNERAGQALCATNWIRTVGWTVRAALMLYAIFRLLPV